MPDPAGSATPVAFIGLGVMGYPMAGHLAARERDVRVFNRTAARAEAWADQYGGTAWPSPAAAADGCGTVFACVGDDDDVRDVVLGADGCLAAMTPGTVLVDHTTTSARLARELYDAAATAGVAFIDAPVSGGQAGAENGQLTVMMGGDAEVIERVAPLVDCYARTQARIGPAGAGQLAKMVNQICIAGVVQGLAEGIHFGQQAGLDIERVIMAISQGAAQSWQMDNRAATMQRGEFDFGFAVDWMRKDLGHVLDEARASGAQLPLTALVDQFYAEVQAMGGRRWDTSSLIARLKKT